MMAAPVASLLDAAIRLCDALPEPDRLRLAEALSEGGRLEMARTRGGFIRLSVTGYGAVGLINPDALRPAPMLA
jgi:hypothetical protein